jgi:hypothetical protein
MMVGVIRRGSGEAGALVRFRNGVYAQLNGETLRPLDAREVLRAMAEGLPARR